MKLRTFYKLFYQHRFKKAKSILKLYLLFVLPIKYLINLIYLPKVVNLDELANNFEKIETDDLGKLFDHFNSDKGNYYENQYAQPYKRSSQKIKAHGYSTFYQKLGQIKFQGRLIR